MGVDSYIDGNANFWRHLETTDVAAGVDIVNANPDYRMVVEGYRVAILNGGTAQRIVLEFVNASSPITSHPVAHFEAGATGIVNESTSRMKATSRTGDKLRIDGTAATTRAAVTVWGRWVAGNHSRFDSHTGTNPP